MALPFVKGGIKQAEGWLKKFDIRPAGSALGVQGVVVFRHETIHVVCRVAENHCDAEDRTYHLAISEVSAGRSRCNVNLFR